MFKNGKSRDGIVKSVAVAYLVLVLHLLLIAGLGVIVIFFRGVTQYLFWIVALGILGIGASLYLFFRKLRAQGKTLGQTLDSPTFAGRAVEVSLLGGFASIKLGNPASPPTVEGPAANHLRLEDPETRRIRELTELARLLEKNLITREEFNKAKRQIME